MIVVVLTLAPKSVLGHVSRYLLEIDSGVFVGTLNSKLREELWQFIRTSVKTGRAIMIYRSQDSQQFSLKEVNTTAQISDFDGVTLIKRRTNVSSETSKKGWSKARRYRRS